MHLSSPSETFEFTRLKEMEVSSTAKVLTAGGGAWNTEIWEEVEGLSPWTGRGVLGKEETDALLYVLVGGRTRRLCSRVKTDGNELKHGIFKEGTGVCGAECEAESEPCGNVTLFRHTLPEVQKSLFTESQAPKHACMPTRLPASTFARKHTSA
jgi:hypothetical protein